METAAVMASDYFLPFLPYMKMPITVISIITTIPAPMAFVDPGGAEIADVWLELLEELFDETEGVLNTLIDAFTLKPT